MLSSHKVEVIPIVLKKHPNADTLSIVDIYGYQAVVNTDQWQGVTKAAWIPPDTLVDTRRTEFNFLFTTEKNALYYADGLRASQVLRKMSPFYYRVRAKRIRQVVSYGLLVPAPDWADVGDDLAEYFQVIHWNPPEPQSNGSGINMTGGEVAKGPNVYSPKYDVDNFQRYAEQVFVAGESVFATEKIHGTNGRWVYHNGEFFCGSRTEWKREYPLPIDPDKIEQQIREKSKLVGEELEASIARMRERTQRKPEKNLWWHALDQYPKMKEWLQAHPDHVLYGEVYGQVQDLKYGTKQGEVRIAVFDILNGTSWMDAHAARLAAPELPWVPTIAENIPFDFNKLVELAEGQSTIPGANHVMEGIVVSPIQERYNPLIGRVKLKIVSSKYLERN